jgi:hypothetical protein
MRPVKKDEDVIDEGSRHGTARQREQQDARGGNAKDEEAAAFLRSQV